MGGTDGPVATLMYSSISDQSDWEHVSDSTPTNLFSTFKRPDFMPWPSVLKPSIDDGGQVEWPTILKPSYQDDKWIEWPGALTSLVHDYDSRGYTGAIRKSKRLLTDSWNVLYPTHRSKPTPSLQEDSEDQVGASHTAGARSFPPIHLEYRRVLKAHQLDGVRFMWRQIVVRKTGCILAHSMGLGKTLQIIVFLSTLRQEVEKRNQGIPAVLTKSRSVLILGPLITLSNWVNEFHKWVPQDMQSSIGHVYNFSDDNARVAKRILLLQQWFTDGGVMLMSYDQYRLLLTTTSNSAELIQFRSFLVDPGPSIVIADEGHRIKNNQAQITTLVKSIRTRARICLTGYPLQNNLAEYYCMLEFVAPTLLGRESEKDNLAKPIENVFAESCWATKSIAMTAQIKLQQLTKDIIHRRDVSILKKDLPPKTEYFISCKLTPVQRDAYVLFLKDLRNDDDSPLIAMILFRAICNHPAIFQKMVLFRQEKLRQQLANDIYNNQEAGQSTVTADDDLDDSKHAEVTDQNEFAAVQQWQKAPPLAWTNDFFDNVKDIDIWHHSNKTMVVMQIAKECYKIGDKLIIVSHSIACLDFLEKLLLTLGFRTARIDGQTPRLVRQSIIDEFNRQPKQQIMFLSARAGGIGVNITGANRVILYDMDWNPCHDEQSIGRVYRYGQEKRVYVYRLLTYSTIEESVMIRSSHKRALASRVIDSRSVLLQSKDRMKKYYRIPHENPKSRLSKCNFSIEDMVMKNVIEKHHDLIIDVSFGENVM